MQRRERALRATIGPSTTVVVAARPLAIGVPVTIEQLAVRSVPRRYAPRAAVDRPEMLVGLRPRVAIPAGHDVGTAALDGGRTSVLRTGERIAEIVAVGDVVTVRPGVRVDLLVTRARGERAGTTRLALENAEVVAVAPTAGDGDAAGGSRGGGGGGTRIMVSLRVTVRQAVYLAAAQNFATELRVLPRSPGDETDGAAGLAASDELDGVR